MLTSEEYLAMDKWQLAERGLKLNAELQRVYQDFQETRCALVIRLLEEGVPDEDAWCDKAIENEWGKVTPEFTEPMIVVEDEEALWKWCNENRYHAGVGADRLLSTRVRFEVCYPTELLSNMEYTPEGKVEYQGIPVQGVAFKDAEPSTVSFHPSAKLKDSTKEGRVI